MDQSLVILLGFLASIGAYLSKAFVIEPLLRFRAVRGRIQNRLKFYSNVITSSGLGGGRGDGGAGQPSPTELRS